MENRQSGFTLVELIVVILILGVLSATALPRFINLNSKAYKAAVTATGGALGTAVSLAKAQWIANGHTTLQQNLEGFGDGTLDVNGSGWPIGISQAAAFDGSSESTDAAKCKAIWDALLNNPPEVVTTGSTGEYLAAANGSSTGCTYTYQRDNSYIIEYETTTGNVSVTS